MNKDAKIIGVYGGRGQGKSTYVKGLLKNYARVIVFDPQNEYNQQPGFTTAGNLNALRDAMLAGKCDKYRIAYVPPQGVDFITALHELCVFLELAQQPYANAKSDKKIALIVEELNLSAPSTTLPRDRQGFVRVCAQGRHFGIEVIGVTQRPKMVMPNFRSQAAEEIVFKLGDHDDIAKIDSKLPPQYKGKIYQLQPHHFIKMAGCDISSGKNPPFKAQR